MSKLLKPDDLFFCECCGEEDIERSDIELNENSCTECGSFNLTPMEELIKEDE